MSMLNIDDEIDHLREPSPLRVIGKLNSYVEEPGFDKLENPGNADAPASTKNAQKRKKMELFVGTKMNKNTSDLQWQKM